jgi:hypothetical protein
VSAACGKWNAISSVSLFVISFLSNLISF